MAVDYNKTRWENREVERPRTYQLVDNGDGTTTLIPAEGNVLSEGTPIVATTMQQIEDAIEMLSITSQISEKGQTSNGHYLKFSNGNLLCWGLMSFSATTGANGALHSVTLPTKGLPASFSHTTYFCGVTPYFTECVGVDIRSRAVDFFEPRIFTISPMTDKYIEMGYFCFGRWYES
jgi:hypothetical protein